jgi:two-component system NtrC family sensor kinase
VLAGKRLSQFIQNQDLLDVLRDDKLSASTRIEITLEDGRVLNVQVTPVPQAGYVIIMHDITHLKELDRIKTEFVNTVSHDLRSPLTAILGYTELIDRVGPVNKKQQEFIRRVQLSVHSITALINDLLDLGRIETGFDARKELIPFSTLLDFSVDGLRNRARDKSQSLILDAPTALPHVLGNPIRLRQMMSNLLGNAIKYTQENGEIRVKVEAEAGQIIMQISDNGPGIPPADLPFIFDKFYRASNIPSDIPGSGLGLAIVKSIVENHLGRIWVDSTLEQGTSFTVVLPSVDSEF